jgi:hypothetical protein
LGQCWNHGLAESVVEIVLFVDEWAAIVVTELSFVEYYVRLIEQELLIYEVVIRDL